MSVFFRILTSSCRSRSFLKLKSRKKIIFDPVLNTSQNLPNVALTPMRCIIWTVHILRLLFISRDTNFIEKKVVFNQVNLTRLRCHLESYQQTTYKRRTTRNQRIKSERGKNRNACDAVDCRCFWKLWFCKKKVGRVEN